MSVEPGSDPLARARALDAQAYGVGEDSAQGRALRAQAAALRVAWLVPRSYPVAICARCFRLTGWTNESGSCHACAVHAARLAAHAASGGWISEPDAIPYAQAETAAEVPLRARLAARLGRAGPLAHASVRAWMERVEPGETGPVEPEPGFESEAATRDEVERVDGRGLLVRFTTVSARFTGGGWLRLATTRIARSTVPNPSEFAADLAVETLVDAWADYQQAVASFNADVWRAEAERRERERLERAAREQALAEQRHVSDLLRE